MAGRYDNPIPTRFLAPIDCSKSPALPYSAPGARNGALRHYPDAKVVFT
jgi:hypothetical protein